MDKVVHFEIPVDDVNRAQGFYKKIFGWKISAVPGMPYWMVNTVETDTNNMPTQPGAINGGIYKRGQEGAKAPVLVVNVSSVDDYVKKVKKAGGSVVLAKRQVGDMGFYAQVSDTEDNIIGLWQMLPRRGKKK
jgi:predicted enzyme related to lactoylglutathione lyase